MEPRPIIIDPPKPEAVPANLGLIDNNPALAFGKEIPLPNPTNVIVPKNSIPSQIPEYLQQVITPCLIRL